MRHLKLATSSWTKLKPDTVGVATQFYSEFMVPLRRLAAKTIDLGAVSRVVVRPGAAAAHIAKQYRRYLFGDATLQALPDAPAFLISATNVQSGAVWHFSKQSMGDWRVGVIINPQVEIADAVAASSAFPPFLSPFLLSCDPRSFKMGTGADLAIDSYQETVELTDGGVYDNLGLETGWATHTTVLVSDGGSRAHPEIRPATDWPRHMLRILDVIDTQVRSLRKRQVIESYKSGERTGAYWGIRTGIYDYGLADSLDCPYTETLSLANLPTRLAAVKDELQERLINWGYAACDASLRRHFDPTLRRPAGFPYPASGI